MNISVTIGPFTDIAADGECDAPQDCPQCAIERRASS